MHTLYTSAILIQRFVLLTTNHRGDTPFCSEECRAVQIDSDEVRERINTKILKERAARNEQRHGAAASEPNITRAGNVPVAS